MEKTVIISGYYGFSNPGDDTLLEIILTTFEKDKSLKPVVLYNTKNSFLRDRVLYIPRNNPFYIIFWMKRADILVSGGGGLFQDSTSLFSFLYYFSIVALARLFRKKIIIYGQSFGPLKRKFSLFLLHYVLHVSDYVFVRDSYSFHLSFSLGGGGKTYLMPDLGYALDVSSPRKKGSLKFVVFPRDRGDIRGFISILEEALKVLNVELSIFPMHYEVDGDIAKEIFYGLKYIKSVKLAKGERNEVLEEIATSLGVISYRFHGLLFAHLLGIPFIGISDDPKIVSYLKDIKGKILSPKRESLIFLKKWMYDVYVRRDIALSVRPFLYMRKKKIKKINEDFLRIIGG